MDTERMHEEAELLDTFEQLLFEMQMHYDNGDVQSEIKSVGTALKDLKYAHQQAMMDTMEGA